MSATRTRGGRRSRRGGGESHGDDERWLLTYADMITLLMALFMVLFSMSSVNTSKFEALKATLADAFSGKVLDGGTGITPAAGGKAADNPMMQPPVPMLRPLSNDQQSKQASQDKENARKEQEELLRLKKLIDAYVAKNRLEAQVETELARRGLLIRLLTDEVLFDSGQAVLKRQSYGLLAQIARIINLDARHPVVVEGHTDDVPIATAQYPSNWELSGARASSVVRFQIDHGVRAARLEASGFADLRPIARNTIAAGRSRNRRVEIVLLRIGRPTGGPVIP
jgi:chemotaxis protein MotB